MVEGVNLTNWRFPPQPLYTTRHANFNTKIIVIHLDTSQEKSYFERVYLGCITFRFQENRSHAFDLLYQLASQQRLDTNRSQQHLLIL